MDQSTVKVRTPEHVELEYELAGIGSRGLAQLVDLLILAAMYIVIIIALVLWVVLHILGGATSYMIGGAILLSFFAFWGYFILFEYYMSGQTPGKRLMHIRVVHRDGRQPGFLAVLLRNVFRLIDILPSGYLVGVVVMISNQTERRIGDLVAGTMVVSGSADSGAALHTLADLDRTYGMPYETAPYKSEGMSVGLPAESTVEALSNDNEDDVYQMITVENLDVGLALQGALPPSWEDFLTAFEKRKRSLTREKRLELAAAAWERLLAEQQAVTVDKNGQVLQTVNLHMQQKLELVAALAEHVRVRHTTQKQRSMPRQQRRKRH